MKTIKTDTHLLLVDETAEIKEGDILPYCITWANGITEVFNSNNGIAYSRVKLAKILIAASPKLSNLPEFETLPPNFNTKECCPFCEGGGVIEIDKFGTTIKCRKCNGKGFISSNTEDNVEKLTKLDLINLISIVRKSEAFKSVMGITLEGTLLRILKQAEQVKSETMFSLEDMRKCYQYAQKVSGQLGYTFEQFIQSLTKPKEYEFVLEMEEMKCSKYGCGNSECLGGCINTKAQPVIITKNGKPYIKGTWKSTN